MGPVSDTRLAERFWEKVDKTGDCWLWTACRTSKGYGQFGIGRRVYPAHRIAFALAFEKPPDSLVVCHRCDNPPCVRPDHLFLGSQSDNLLDAFAKGRGFRLTADRNPNTKLTDEQVATIRERVAAGERYTAIAPAFGVTPQYVGQLARGEWRRP